MTDPVLVYVAVGCLAGIFLLGAIDKLRHFTSFEAAAAAYALMPSWLLRPFTVAFVLAEGLAAVLLLVPGNRALGAICALGVLLLASAGIAINLLRGRRNIDCGCGGLSGPPSELSGWLVLRNAGLMLLAVLVLIPVGGPQRSLGWVDAVTFFGATLALLGLYFALSQLIESHVRLQKI
ncbi:methylamine utilization protein MauE [Alcaligenaceae bacterium CGII-47]|nr:methylamine utilization protein MauE [Alcaligenaceae bacterium CGII-47]